MPRALTRPGSSFTIKVVVQWADGPVAQLVERCIRIAEVRDSISLGSTTMILLFYKYITIVDPKTLAEKVRVYAEKLDLLGRIIVAEEGINGTVESSSEAAQEFSDFLHTLPGLADMNIKTSEGERAFRKLSVKVRKEIVGTHFPQDIDPRVRTAVHIPAQTLREWYRSGKQFTVVDMRNSYEYASGHFKNSIDPGMEASRDLPEVMPKLAPYKNKTVVTVCTGGVRCEKMSAYLLKEGFTDVYQLENGIHTYMQQFPGEDFEGTLYTFDTRVTMDFGGKRKVVGACTFCGKQTERYINCAQGECRTHFLACTECAPHDRAMFCTRCK